MLKTFPAPLAQPEIEVLDITPELAAELLERNNRNRPKKQYSIDGWVKDMQAGQWDGLNGETYKFAHDGELLDGQNRLTAIVVSGVTQKGVVFWGLAREAQDTIDMGNKRTFAQQLGMRGYSNCNVLAGIVRSTFLWDAGERRSIGHGKIVPTVHELSRHLSEHSELVDVAKQAMWQYGDFRPLSPTMQGLGIYLFDQINSEERQDFFMRLIEGANMDKDHPIMVLRKHLLQRHTHLTTRLLPEQKVAILIKAWNAYRDGRTVEALYWRGGGKSPEAFPEPR